MFVNGMVRSYYDNLFKCKLVGQNFGHQSQAQYLFTGFKNVTSEADSGPESETYLLLAKLRRETGFNDEQIYVIPKRDESSGAFCIEFVGTVLGHLGDAVDYNELASYLNSNLSVTCVNTVHSRTELFANMNFFTSPNNMFMYYAKLEVTLPYQNQFIGDIAGGFQTGRHSEVGELIFNVMMSYFLAPYFNARLLILNNW